jgi:hypothetical protein
MMTIEKLEKYYGISSNIEAIDEEIRTLYNPVSSPNGKQGTGGSNTPSNPTERSAMRIVQLKELLECQRQELYELVEEIERWLTTVEDTEIVSIIRWHYLLKLNWRQTNLKVYGYPDYYYSRQKIIKYFEKISNISNG